LDKEFEKISKWSPVGPLCKRLGLNLKSQIPNLPSERTFVRAGNQISPTGVSGETITKMGNHKSQIPKLKQISITKIPPPGASAGANSKRDIANHFLFWLLYIGILNLFIWLLVLGI